MCKFLSKKSLLLRVVFFGYWKIIQTHIYTRGFVCKVLLKAPLNLLFLSAEVFQQVVITKKCILNYSQGFQKALQFEGKLLFPPDKQNHLSNHLDWWL